METVGFRKCAVRRNGAVGGCGGGAWLAPPQTLTETSGFLQAQFVEQA
jgi:hypothetical protein